MQDIIPGQLPQIDALTFDNSLGDIFLCPSVIKEQCVQDETNFQNSLPVCANIYELIDINKFQNFFPMLVTAPALT